VLPHAARCDGDKLWAVKHHFLPNYSLVAIACLFALPALVTAATPTVADAQAFMNKAQAELLDLNTIEARAGWVQETYITGDT
jgi:peptidyl-dipeptidase A